MFSIRVTSASYCLLCDGRPTHMKAIPKQPHHMNILGAACLNSMHVPTTSERFVLSSSVCHIPLDFVTWEKCKWLVTEVPRLHSHSKLLTGAFLGLDSSSQATGSNQKLPATCWTALSELEVSFLCFCGVWAPLFSLPDTVQFHRQTGGFSRCCEL